MVLRHKRLRAEKFYNYWFMLFLIFVFAVNNRTMLCLVHVYCLCICLGLIFLKSGSVFEVGTHIADERIRPKQCLCNCVNSEI
jgi:hypothetical protein